MHNLILATIAVIFAAVVVGGGLNYFQPSVMARVNVGDPLALGFERLGAAWTAYTLANGEPPLGQNEDRDGDGFADLGGACWWDQLAPYADLPAPPSEVSFSDDPDLDGSPNNCGGIWYYDVPPAGHYRDEDPYFCVFIEVPANAADDATGTFIYDTLRRAMSKFEPNEQLGADTQEKVMIDVTGCAPNWIAFTDASGPTSVTYDPPSTWPVYGGLRAGIDGFGGFSGAYGITLIYWMDCTNDAAGLADGCT